MHMGMHMECIIPAYGRMGAVATLVTVGTLGAVATSIGDLDVR